MTRIHRLCDRTFVLVLLLAARLAIFSDGFLVANRASVSRQQPRQPPSFRSSGTRCNNWLGDLWEELIEFSTYGPAERKMLKAKREAAAASEALSSASFQEAKEKVAAGNVVRDSNDESPSLSLEAFQSAVAASEASKNNDDNDLEFDGYALRDLLVAKWGVPLDIDFQRGYSSQQPSVHCVVLPFAYGSMKCRHLTELDYLMHLQAVVSILYEYDNLDEFRDFVETTSRAPKPGVESVPFRLELSPRQLQRVLGVTQ